MRRRCVVELVIHSSSLRDEDLARLLGPSEEPAVSKPKGRFENTVTASWTLISKLGDEHSPDDHLDSLLGRFQPAIDTLPTEALEAMRATLRIVQYIPAIEDQGLGFVVAPQWVELLGKLRGSVDVDQYTVDDM